ADEGHEVAPHGWDHVGWQDRIHRLAPSAIRDDLARAARAFEAIFGQAPHASAAPGWRTSPDALVIQEECGLRYASDTRGEAPFPRLDEIAAAALAAGEDLRVAPVIRGRVGGRNGWVSAPGPASQATPGPIRARGGPIE